MSKQDKMMLPTKKVKRPSENLKISALSNVNVKKYIKNVDLRMPDKVNYKENVKEINLNSIKKSAFDTENKNILSTSEINSDTGVVKFGYDKEKKDIVTFWKYHDGLNEKEKNVFENRSRFHRVNESATFRSNDEKFSDGAVDFRFNKSRDYNQMLSQFKSLSNKTKQKNKVDGVMPYISEDQENQKIDKLNKLKQNSKDKINIQSAIDALDYIKNKKDMKRLETIKMLTKSIDYVNQLNMSDDFYFIQIKKKLALLDELKKLGIEKVKNKKDLEKIISSLDPINSKDLIDLLKKLLNTLS